MINIEYLKQFNGKIVLCGLEGIHGFPSLTGVLEIIEQPAGFGTLAKLYPLKESSQLSKKINEHYLSDMVPVPTSFETTRITHISDLADSTELEIL